MREAIACRRDIHYTVFMNEYLSMLLTDHMLMPGAGAVIGSGRLQLGMAQV